MSGNINSVFYADSYHPIQSGSIDGTDILPHDNAVYRAHLCSSARLYDPFGDPKIIGDPYCTLFVGLLNHLTTEHTLHKVMSTYGKVKNLRLVRHIGHCYNCEQYGHTVQDYPLKKTILLTEKILETDDIDENIAEFVLSKPLLELHVPADFDYGANSYEIPLLLIFSLKLILTFKKAGKNDVLDAHHIVIDDSEIIVDYNRQQLMPGWIPRRLGGGLGGKKESGQLRFGGRERPFRAPLRPIPYDDLKRLGIPPPPEGQYMTRFEVPSPPRRPRSSVDRDEHSRSHSHSHKRQKHSKHSRRHDRRRSSSKDHFSD